MCECELCGELFLATLKQNVIWLRNCCWTIDFSPHQRRLEAMISWWLDLSTHYIIIYC